MKKHPLNKGVNIRVTDAVYEKLRILADKRNQHLGEYVREIIDNHLNNNEEV